MSGSSEIMEFSCQKSSRMSEMMTFSQKCSMFNQCSKEKGSFGDLNQGMSCTPVEWNGSSDMFHQSTKMMNLFPVTEKPSVLAPPQDFVSMNLFPMHAVFGSSVPKEEISKIDDSSISKPASGAPERAPMTIFYAGQVYVFENFSANKAKEVMNLASKESSETHPAYYNMSSPAKNNFVFPSHLNKSPNDSSNPVLSSSAAMPNFGNKMITKNIQAQPPSQPIFCNLPIARKASLHRFLEKRKDRINAKAPYQTASPAKPDESKSWLGLAAQPTQ